MNATTALLALALFGAGPPTTAIDGKPVFEANCASCQSVESEAIPAGNLHVVLNVDWNRTCQGCTPDLSDIGDRRTSAGWLRGYLRGGKKGRNGLRHNEVPITLHGDALIVRDGPGRYTLTDAELDALVSWLLTVRQDGTRRAESAAGMAPPSAPASIPSDAASILLNARTGAVVGQTGAQLSNRLWANPNGDRAKEKVEAVLREWGTYQLVAPDDQPDLLLVVHESQKNLSLIERANLVAGLKVYRGGQDLTDQTPARRGDDETLRTGPLAPKTTLDRS